MPADISSLLLRCFTAATIRNWRSSLVSNSSLELFRISLGLLLSVEMVCVWRADMVAQSYSTAIRIPLSGWEWLPNFPGAGTSGHLIVIGVAGLGIAAGWATRACLWGACIFLANLLLLDESAYLNHHYLMVLLCGLLGAMPIGRRWQLGFPTRSMEIPLTCVWVMRIMLVLPYFFGGLAKLNADWLHGEPLGHWFRSKSGLPWVGPWLAQDELILVSCWGSLLLDLFAPFLLLWRRTRFLTFVLLVVFHVMNSLLWDIGAFPWLMIAGSTLFFPPDWAERKSAGATTVSTTTVRWPKTRIGLVLLSCFLLLQVALPLRYLLSPGDVRWTGEGACFSWRMMHKRVEGAVIYDVVNPGTGERLLVDPSTVLSSRQLAALPGSVNMIRLTALALAESVEREAGFWPRVSVRTLVSLNGRTPQAIVRDDVDLADVRLRTRDNRQIIVPLKSD